MDSITVITESVYRDNGNDNDNSTISSHSLSHASNASNPLNPSSHASTHRSTYCNLADPVNKNLIIDVAVLCHEYTELDKLNNDHIINLDDIPITIETFQSIYYAHGENFAMDKKFVTKKNVQPFISFLPEHRAINKERFCLLEQLFLNIEQDLNISRDCFTVESKVELSNEISGIRYIYDVNASGLLSSLTWSNIMEIIKNYKLLHDNNCKKGEIKFIFVVSVVFKTPTPGVKNTVVRFNYIITNI